MLTIYITLLVIYLISFIAFIPAMIHKHKNWEIGYGLIFIGSGFLIFSDLLGQEIRLWTFVLVIFLIGVMFTVGEIGGRKFYANKR